MKSLINPSFSLRSMFEETQGLGSINNLVSFNSYFLQSDGVFLYFYCMQICIVVDDKKL